MARASGSLEISCFPRYRHILAHAGAPIKTFDKTDVEKVAQLARLHISDSEIDEVTGRITDILALIDQMQSVDTDAAVPLAHPLDLTQRLREDDVTETNRRDELQLLAPEVEEGLYLVPKVIE